MNAPHVTGANYALTAPFRILHVSGDYPDAIDSFKTPVIKSLIELTRNTFNHHVYSINRRSPPMGALASSILQGGWKPRLDVRQMPFADGVAFEYLAPGRGVFHATMLRQLGERLAQETARDALRPDLLVGHKLGIEGIVVRRMAQLLNIPFAISIQGDTDTKILQMRPDLRGELGRVFHEATVIFPFSPWATRRIEQKLGKREGPTITLPCPTDLDEPVSPHVAGNKELLSVFHLKNHKRKNLKGLAAAMRKVALCDPQIKLTVIGGGSAQDIAACQTLIADLPNASLAGPMDREQLRQRFQTAVGFVMPSRRESFGLVFIEALFAGLPIIYPEGTSVDGFFAETPFAIKVPASEPSRIAQAILSLVENETQAKQALAMWQRSEASHRFTRPVIADEFARGLFLAITG